MFERFTTRARRVIVLSQEEARGFGHNYVGTEHILLGLIHEGSGVAAKALQVLGVDLDQTRIQIEGIVGRGDPRIQIERTTGRGDTRFQPTGHIPFTPRSKRVLELALGEALDLGHTYIGTEHLLLGLMRERDGLGAQVLLGSGIEFASVRQQIRQLLTGRREDDAPPPSERPAEPPGPSGDTTDDLTGRLASVAARLAVIELRLRDSAPGAGG